MVSITKRGSLVANERGSLMANDQFTSKPDIDGDVFHVTYWANTNSISLSIRDAVNHKHETVASVLSYDDCVALFRFMSRNFGKV